MILSGLTLICSLFLSLSGINGYSSMHVSEINNEKSVIFEGNYINMPASEAINKINSKDSENVKISFFY